MLNELRSKLDSIDTDISKLLVERLNIVKLIGIEKQKTGWNTSIDKEREKRVINNIIVHSNEKYEKEALKEIYITIMNESKKIQDRILNK